nr:penicillin-binding transpeptidase domain-containing protein [Alkalibacillus aidingensis]
MKEFLSLWEEGNYEIIYEDHLTESTREQFTYEDYGERYESLYETLEVEDFSVEITEQSEMTEEQLEQLKEISDYTIPIHISFETLAGSVDYEQEVSLEKLEVEDDDGQLAIEKWLVEWDPSFILPGLEPGEEVWIDTLTANRGDILDRHGNFLATTGEVYEIGVTPEAFNESQLSNLAEILNLTEDYIENKYQQNWVEPHHFVPIRNVQITDEDIRDQAVSIDGVSSRIILDRVYPYDEAAAHLVGYIAPISQEELEERADEGYTSADRIGKRGLEQLFESRLKGEDGVEIYIEKNSGATETVVKQEEQDGEDIQLTIDIEIQESLYDIAKEESGTAVALNPQTGEVNALLSFPSFDPNQFVLGMSNTQHEELMSNEHLPTVNRFASTYSPGSTMKLLTSLIGFDTQELDPDEVINIEGKHWQKEGWSDYRVTRLYDQYTDIDLEAALKHSDNIYFAMLGLAIGGDRFVEGLKQLGFEESIPFTYPVTKSQISNNGQLQSEGQIADTSFGQGEVLVNIIHLSSIYGGIANDGTVMTPRLLQDESSSIWYNQLASEEEVELLQEYLRLVVSEGTAQSIDISGREMAGKTGTAELKASHDDDNDAENGIFFAYDQAQPDLLLGIIVEDVGDRGGSGVTIELSKLFFEQH